MKPNEIIVVGNFEIKIERKKIKNIYLKVKPTGEVVISTPMNAKQSDLQQFAQSKLDWLEQKQEVIKQRQATGILPKESDQTVYYLGKCYDILKVKATKKMVTLDAPYVKIYVTSSMSEENQNRSLQKWLQQKLEHHIQAYMMKYWDYFKTSGISPIEIKYRQMNSTWGVCRPIRRTITFNKRLIQCHPQFIEYVVVHELCHLIHPNHSPQFYKLVEQLMPEWKNYSKLSR